MILDYTQFILESKDDINNKKVLHEYVISHMHDSIFQIKSDDFYKEVDVAPYKSETLDKLKKAYNDLLNVLQKEHVNDLYQAVTSAERINYNYGNVLPKFSLITIPEIEMNLTEEQIDLLKSSEREFLLNTFSQLDKGMRTDIIQELTEHGEVLACVIEALFYYIRTINKDDFYNGMNHEEILDDYKERIKEVSKELHFSYEGPFDDYSSKSKLTEDSKCAFWTCEKNLRKFLIQGTVNVKELYAEDNIGTPGLSLSLLMANGTAIKGDYSYFPLDELEERVKSFFKKYEDTK